MGIETLNRFLQASHQVSSAEHPLHLVLGNESADLDSVVSALMYAFLRWATAAPQDPKPVAVINASPGAVHQRPEVVYLLADAGISLSGLCYYDELGLRGATSLQKTRLTLVDHHILAPGQHHLEAQVSGIIDHHPDSGNFPHCIPRIIEPVASCATLVAERMFKERPGLLNPVIAKLLLGPILLDSVNLDPQAGRCHAKDRQTAGRLCDLAGVEPSAFYSTLAEARLDISGLDTPDLLRRDLKFDRRGDILFAVSAVPVKLDHWLAETPDLPGKIHRFALKRSLDLLLVLTYYPNPQFERRVVAWSRSPEYLGALFDHFNAHGAELTSIDPPPSCQTDPGSQGVEIWIQRNLHMTRKHVMPLIQSFPLSDSFTRNPPS